MMHIVFANDKPILVLGYEYTENDGMALVNKLQAYENTTRYTKRQEQQGSTQKVYYHLKEVDEYVENDIYEYAL